MYCVYWSVMDDKWLELQPCSKVETELTLALKRCETLRNDPNVRFVVMAIEDPNMVGKMGVADVDENYDWHKRRDSISMRKKGLV